MSNTSDYIDIIKIYIYIYIYEKGEIFKDRTYHGKSCISNYENINYIMKNLSWALVRSESPWVKER